MNNLEKMDVLRFVMTRAQRILKTTNVFAGCLDDIGIDDDERQRMIGQYLDVGIRDIQDYLKYEGADGPSIV